MQWQHGKWVKNADGTLTLTPLAVDGRQLLSEPCNGKNAVYTRYNQSEEFEVSCIEIVSTRRRRRAHLLTVRALAEIRANHRPLPQHPAPEPLQIRRLPHEPNVPRLPPASDASNNHSQPSSHCDRNNYRQEQLKAWPRRRSAPRLEAQARASEQTHGPAHQRRQAVVVRPWLDWCRWTFVHGPEENGHSPLGSFGIMITMAGL